jgi:hypothetical protein
MSRHSGTGRAGTGKVGLSCRYEAQAKERIREEALHETLRVESADNVRDKVHNNSRELICIVNSGDPYTFIQVFSLILRLHIN